MPLASSPSGHSYGGHGKPPLSATLEWARVSSLTLAAMIFGPEAAAGGSEFKHGPIGSSETQDSCATPQPRRTKTRRKEA